MNIKKILIIASVALASIAAGYGLVGLRPAGGAGSGTGSDPLIGVGDGTPRVVYLDATASYRDDDDRDDDGWDDDRWDDDRWDDDRYEDEDRDHEERGSERHEHEDDDHDDD